MVKILDAKYAKVKVDDCVPVHLTEPEQAELRQLLLQFDDLNQGTIGTMPGEPYEFELKESAQPYHARPFGIPHAYLDTVKKEVARLERLGVIVRDSSSPWAAPAFIIPKKDKTARFLTDFRRLNALIVRHPFPMPKITELLQGLKRFVFVTSLDMNMGYYSIVLGERSSRVCCFVLPWGKFRYLRLPMGICTAPDEFQRRMQRMLGDLPFVRVYLDDVLIITSTNFADHRNHIRTVFERFRTSGLQVNMNKSRFAALKTEYLGFRLTRDGIQPLPDKIKAIQQLAPPKTKRELRRFVGLVNYYRDMWPQRAHLLTPLTSLTSPRTPFRWTPACQTTFEQIKAVVGRAVTLHFPNFSLPFEVHTDASTFQLGGVVSQNGKPLAFFSRKLSSAQRKYAVMELELLSIVEVLREFRNILLGHRIIVHTDHKNLSFANFQSDRVNRWRLIVEEFASEIKYIKGENNVVADALSQLPLVEDGSETCFALEPCDDDFPLAFERIQSEQLRDEQLQQRLRDGQVETKQHGEFKIIYSTNRIVIPPALQHHVTNWYHEQLKHPGMNRTYLTIRQHFTWMNMKRCIEEFVSRCEICQKWKRNKKNYGKLPVAEPVVEPWKVVCVDLIGSYTHAATGNKYSAMTMIDPATGWFEVHAITDKEAKTAAHILDNEWFCRYRRPECCIFDQGNEFTGAEFQETLESYGVKPRPTTVKNPQANSVLERIHQVLGDMVRTSDLDANAWEQVLPSVAFAIRATVSTTKEATPAQLVFGRDMVMNTAFMANWKRITDRKLRQVLRHNERENSSRLQHTYRVGDLVLITKDKNRISKLNQPTEGPFKILQVNTNGTVQIQRSAYVEIINIRRLVPYRSVGKANAVSPPAIV